MPVVFEIKLDLIENYTIICIKQQQLHHLKVFYEAGGYFICLILKVK